MSEEIAKTRAQSDELSNELAHFLRDGGTFGMLNNISAESLEQLYALAFARHQAGKWDEAHKLFQLLCILDHYDGRFYLGLGACRQSLGQWQQAADSYSYGALLDNTDPRFPFYAAECHLQLGALDAAESGFYTAAALAEPRPEYADLAARAHVMQDAVILKKSVQKGVFKKE